MTADRIAVLLDGLADDVARVVPAGAAAARRRGDVRTRRTRGLAAGVAAAACVVAVVLGTSLGERTATLEDPAELRVVTVDPGDAAFVGLEAWAVAPMTEVARSASTPGEPLYVCDADPGAAGTVGVRAVRDIAPDDASMAHLGVERVRVFPEAASAEEGYRVLYRGLSFCQEAEAERFGQLLDQGPSRFSLWEVRAGDDTQLVALVQTDRTLTTIVVPNDLEWSPENGSLQLVSGVLVAAQTGEAFVP